MSPDMAFWVVWAVLFLYALTGAIDYGVTAFFLTGVRTQDHELAALSDRYTAPVWETVNTLLIFFAVALIGFLPGSIAYIGTAMLLPGALGLALMAVRNVAFAFRKMETPAAPRIFPWLNAVAGLLSPLPFMAFFAVLQGHGIIQLPNGGIGADFAASIFNPLTLVLMLVALTSELFLGGLFVAWYAREQGNSTLSQKLTATNTRWSYVALAALLISLPVVMPGAATGGKALFVLGLLAVLLSGIVSRKTTAAASAFALGILGYALGFVALGLSQGSYIVRPYLTAAQAFNNPAMLHSLLIVLVVGVIVVVPAVWLTTRFVLDRGSPDHPII